MPNSQSKDTYSKPDYRIGISLFLSAITGFLGGIYSNQVANGDKLVQQDGNIKCKSLQVVGSDGKTQIELSSTTKGPSAILKGNQGTLSVELLVEDFATNPKEQSAGLYIRRAGFASPALALAAEDDNSSSITLGDQGSPAFAALRVFPTKPHEFAQLSVGGLHQAEICSELHKIRFKAGQGSSNIELGKTKDDPPYFLINDQRVKNGAALMKLSHYSEK